MGYVPGEDQSYDQKCQGGDVDALKCGRTFLHDVILLYMFLDQNGSLGLEFKKQVNMYGA